MKWRYVVHQDPRESEWAVSFYDSLIFLTQSVHPTHMNPSSRILGASLFSAPILSAGPIDILQDRSKQR
jgi:hypothetical protein